MDSNKMKMSGSRREMLKKAGVAAAFVVPTLVTFKVSELQAAQPSWSGGPGGNPAAPGQKKK